MPARAVRCRAPCQGCSLCGVSWARSGKPEGEKTVLRREGGSLVRRRSFKASQEQLGVEKLVLRNVI